VIGLGVVRVFIVVLVSGRVAVIVDRHSAGAGLFIHHREAIGQLHLGVDAKGAVGDDRLAFLDAVLDHVVGARPVAAGQFGAEMRVALVNDGPVTIVLDSRDPE